MTRANASVDRIAALVELIKLFQDAVDRFDALAAEVLQVNTTDLRCLTILRDRGSLQAHAVASELGLTRGATTTAIRRMASMGYVARREEGRRVIISLTEVGEAKVAAIWTPIVALGREYLSRYSDSELSLLSRFFEDSIDLQRSCTALLQEEKKGVVRVAGVPSSQYRMRRPEGLS